MELRSRTVTGPVVLPAAGRPLFEEGLQLVFSKWTALDLAVQNEWGGMHSKDKAVQLMRDTADWFYAKKGAGRRRMEADPHRCVGSPGQGRPAFGVRAAEHYADELEEELADAMLADFNAELEDGSPLAVRRCSRGQLCRGALGWLIRQPQES